MKNNCGFTLVEIMIAVCIIGIVSALALPHFGKAREDFQRNTCLANQRVIFESANLYEMMEKASLAGGTNGVVLRDTLINNGYIERQKYFECPGSPIPDYDDYRLVYTGDELVGIRCSVNPDDHILP